MTDILIIVLQVWVGTFIVLSMLTITALFGVPIMPCGILTMRWIMEAQQEAREQAEQQRIDNVREARKASEALLKERKIGNQDGCC